MPLVCRYSIANAGPFSRSVNSLNVFSQERSPKFVGGRVRSLRAFQMMHAFHASKAYSSAAPSAKRERTMFAEARAGYDWKRGSEQAVTAQMFGLPFPRSFPRTRGTQLLQQSLGPRFRGDERSLWDRSGSNDRAFSSARRAATSAASAARARRRGGST